MKVIYFSFNSIIQLKVCFVHAETQLFVNLAVYTKSAIVFCAYYNINQVAAGGTAVCRTFVIGKRICAKLFSGSAKQKTRGMRVKIRYFGFLPEVIITTPMLKQRLYHTLSKLLIVIKKAQPALFRQTKPSAYLQTAQYGSVLCYMSVDQLYDHILSVNRLCDNT